MLKTLKRLSFVLVLVGAIATFFMYQEALKQYREGLEKQHARLLSRSSAILEDLRLLEKAPLFPVITSESDASEFLSTIVSWDGAGFEPIQSTNHKLLREVIADHPGWAKNAQDLKALAEDPRIDQINTSWIGTLEAFDHWNINRQAEVQTQLERVKNLNALSRLPVLATLPIPDYNELSQWAIVHVLKGKTEGHVASRLKGARKLAELIQSSGTIVGNMVAAGILELEPALVEMFADKDWVPATKESVEAFKRVTWAMVGLVRLPFDGPVPAEFEPYLTPQMGLCSALRESLGTYFTMMDLLEPTAPMELDLRPNFNRLRDFQTGGHAKCGMSAFDVFTEPPPASANPWRVKNFASIFGVKEEKSNLLSEINWAKVPYIRRVVGFAALNVTMVDPLSGFEQKPEAFE